ncbi:MAG TPA: DJ-1/PfpI family protein [Burkholderiales bacterium]|nr:DJ-1/PfpI family protein [Burkholderiales bacterium]
MLIFDDMTQLDFTGPYEVFAQMKNCQVRVIAKTRAPVVAKGGLRFIPDTTLAEAPGLDIVFVPGGPGVGPLMQDREVLEFLRRQAQAAKYVTSVCTGALVLGAAGLLKGYRATTHWLSLELLPVFGAITAAERVVQDRNRITGGGVTAGIDFALAIAAEAQGEAAAKAIQLLIEYNPAPPFACGHPSTAEPPLVEALRRERAPMQAQRLEAAKRAAALYCA